MNLSLRQQLDQLQQQHEDEMAFEREQHAAEMERLVHIIESKLQRVAVTTTSALDTLEDTVSTPVEGQLVPIGTVSAASDTSPFASPFTSPPPSTKVATLEDCVCLFDTLMRNDTLHSQMTRPKRAAMGVVDYFTSGTSVDQEQLELYKKAYATTSSKKALAIVRSVFTKVDPIVVQIASRLDVAETNRPELCVDREDADNAICLLHLHAACRRVHVQPLSRSGFSALYLGQYREIQERFAGLASITTKQIITFLRDVPKGIIFWHHLCVAAGIQPQPYDSKTFQVEHVHNHAWGGPDHFSNYMILHAALNRCVEFRFGPGEVKMAVIGRVKYEYVQRFVTWSAKQPVDRPRDAFCRMSENYFALPPIELTPKALHYRDSKRKR